MPLLIKGIFTTHCEASNESKTIYIMTTQTQNPSNGCGMAKASIVLGIVSLCLNLLPLISAWFLMISWISWICIILAIVFGIIGIVKGAKKPAIIGLVITLVAILFPVIFANLYVDSAMESTVNALETLDSALDSLEATDSLAIE